MSDTLLIRCEFWTLVLASIGLPFAVVATLVRTTVIPRRRLLFYSVILIVLGGFDIGLLRTVMFMAKLTPGLIDDTVFLSEYSAALYLLPFLSAGVGVNLLTYAITQHLSVQDAGGANVPVNLPSP